MFITVFTKALRWSLSWWFCIVICPDHFNIIQFPTLKDNFNSLTKESNKYSSEQKCPHFSSPSLATACNVCARCFWYVHNENFKKFACQFHHNFPSLCPHLTTRELRILCFFNNCADVCTGFRQIWHCGLVQRICRPIPIMSEITEQQEALYMNIYTLF
jgi:hypothetical protein